MACGLDIVRVELVGVIEMLSGSPLNELVLLLSHVAASPMMPARHHRLAKKCFYEPSSESWLGPGQLSIFQTSISPPSDRNCIGHSEAAGGTSESPRCSGRCVPFDGPSWLA